jgi:hypothetical protein
VEVLVSRPITIPKSLAGGVHILKDRKGPIVKTGCGREGEGHLMGNWRAGIATTVWPDLVTCKICVRLPSVAKHPAHAKPKVGA